MKNSRKPRILLSKLGLDGHERGIVMVALALRDAGMEVIYLGKHKTVEQIVQSAIEEDVDIIGLSSLADAHRTLAPKVTNLLRKKGSDIPVILGGFIQPEDVPSLKEAGIAEVFGIGSRLETITTYIKAKATR